MKRKLCQLTVFFFVLWMMVVPAHAAMGSYHPPAVTILTVNAPSDLEISIRLHKRDGTVIPSQLQKKTRLWEQQFRLYREAVYGVTNWYGNDYDLQDSEIVLLSGGQERVIPLPRELTDLTDIDNVLVLNYRTGEITLGEPFLRTPLLTLMRVAVAVGMECLVFYLYHYAEKRTYLLVILVGIVTNGLLHWFTSGNLNTDPRWVILYMLFLLLAIFAQVLVLVMFVEEYDKNRTLAATVVANLAAIAATTVILAAFPV